MNPFQQEELSRSLESLAASDPDPIVVLKKRKTESDDARAMSKPPGSLDQRYWAQAAKIEEISLEREEIKRKVSRGSYVGTIAPWEDTDDAKNIAEKIIAHKKAKEICERRIQQLDEERPCRSLRTSFMKLFTTSKMGLDPTWDKLNWTISSGSNLKFKDLENRRLKFRSNARPAGRYLYFNYCIQVLRSVWQRTGKAKAKEEASKILREENGKPFWGTPGRYLPENMLRAFVEELGHGYEALLEGASRTSGDEQLLLDTATNQVKRDRESLSLDPSEDEDEGSYPSDEDE
ncbi:hypothetical protein N7463_009638 [Penicillium fimorum]|uniref:Uncharacterized protein n=1 Tax=Penicillium fimorum TaxID=1882269 RepID=A0A9W9XID1_9EURO|nr:hypothetical protein N7463_009638 [Penicillium fimorum]